MAHPAVELAGLLVGFLNHVDRPWSTADFTAAYQAIPGVRKGQADYADYNTVLRVIVAPGAWSGELATRGGGRDDDVAVTVAFIQKLPATVGAYDTAAAGAWIDARFSLIAQVFTESQRYAAELGTYAAGQFQHQGSPGGAGLVSESFLQEANLFVSVLVANYKRFSH